MLYGLGRCEPVASTAEINLQKDLKIYMVGAQSVGKTSLARWTSAAYKLPLIAETARTELAKLEISFDRLRVDVEMTSRYQRNVFDAQLQAEQGKHRFVADRAFFDNLAYLARHARGLRQVVNSSTCRRAAAEMRRGLDAGTTFIFFIRPHHALIQRDGFRAEGDLDMAGLWAIDGAISFMLELWGLDGYVPIEGSSPRERQRVVQAVLKGRV